MSLPAQIFPGFTQPLFDQLAAKVETELHISITANSGSDSAHGVTIDWDLDLVTGKLEIQCLSKPWYVGDATVQQKIQDLVAGVQGVQAGTATS